MRVGVQAGLSVDHLVTAQVGARYAQLGGPGLYAALGARLIAGVTPVLLTDLPDDEPRFSALFDRLGINTSAAGRVPTVPALWILNAPQGRRIVAVQPLDIEIDGGSAESLHQERRAPISSRGVELSGLLLSNPPMTEVDLPPGKVLGVDPDQALLLAHRWKYLGSITRAGCVVLPSRVHLRLIADDPWEAAIELARRADATVVARMDEDGMYVVDGPRAWTLTDERVRVEETTGAGDASAAAIVAALCAGYPIEEAAALGMSIARIALSSWGAQALIEADPISLPLPHINITEVRP